MIPITLGGRPLADFTQPLQMLQDCHRRIEHFLDRLLWVARQFAGSDLSEEGRQTLERSLTYFHQSAPHHTADEEESLFPRLRRSNDAAARAALAELDRLEADHLRADVLHQQVEELGRRWLELGRLDPDDLLAFATALDELAAIYAEHIRLEDERVFQLASQALKPDELREVGEEMKRRRVLAQPCASSATSTTTRQGDVPHAVIKTTENSCATVDTNQG